MPHPKTVASAACRPPPPGYASSMSWIARLPWEWSQSAAALRDRSDIEAASHDGDLYLRPGRGTELDTFRQRLPRAEFFAVHQGRLRPLAARLPVARMPKLQWHPLAELLPVMLPASRAVSVSPPAIRPTLVRSHAVRPIGGVLTTPAELLAYVDSVPIVRLAGCELAVDADRVLVVGERVPAVRGRRLAVDDNVAVEAGWAIDPAIATATLRGLVGAGGQDVVLATADGIDVVAADRFVPLTRATAKLSLGADND